MDGQGARRRINLWMDKSLADQVAEVAERERRSVTAQVTVILEDWLAKHEAGEQSAQG